jgi:hypothetical protein
MSRRTIRFRENLPPRLEAIEGHDYDLVEEVFPRARNPRFGDKAGPFEPPSFVVEIVNNVVEDLWW